MQSKKKKRGGKGNSKYARKVKAGNQMYGIQRQYNKTNFTNNPDHGK